MVLAVVAGLFVIGRLLDIHAYLTLAREAVAGLGRWGIVLYALAYVVATLLFFPGTPFTIVAALLFGPWMGFAVMTVATTVSATIAFLLARYLAKDWMERRLGQMARLQRLRRLTEENHRFVIPTVRFLPMFPYSFNNYALGLTNISFGSYLLWSELVFIPMNAVMVWGANALYQALVLGQFSWALIGGSTAAGLGVLTVGYLLKRRVRARDRQAARSPRRGP